MLSMSFKGVRGLPHSPDGSSPGEEKGMWSVQVQHGTQRHRTRSIELARSEMGDFVGTSDGGARWDKEVEICDKEGQETVEISLVFEREPAGVPLFRWSNNRRGRRHANTTVDMRSFRSRPDERRGVTTWLPLRSVVSSNCDNDAGAIQVKFVYSGDCMVQGYLFTLFCGLIPLPLPDSRTDDIPAEREHVAVKNDDTLDHLPSTAPSSPRKTESFEASAEEKSKLPSAEAQLVPQITVAHQECPRRVRFGSVSELVFQDWVEAGAA